MHVRRILQFVWISFVGFFCSAADTNSLRPWDDYRTIMWIGNSAYKKPEKLPLFLDRLREMGVNTAMVHGDGDPRPLIDNKFHYYVENMVTRGLCLKFSSKVTDWDKFVTGWAKNGRPESALVRDYSLDDPMWQAGVRKQMQSLVRKNMGNAPLAYDIRDELSVTFSANPFDYDFSPVTLAKFREWLRTQYKDLNALNEEWQTVFKSWDEVKPFTTDEIKNRMASGDVLPRGKPDWHALQRLKFDPAEAVKHPARWNFSPWCDFRTYMDVSLARTLNELRNAARELDPRTPVGIEGTQMPSAFGGYDLWRLSQVLDWVEPYDIGNAREIFGSFMRGKPIMTTVFEKDIEHASRRLWHLLLEGDRGCIVWWSEDCIHWNNADYALTAKAKALAPVLKEMTSPLAQLFLRAERERDPVYILYSQPSIQVDWLLESTRDGSTWLRRFSSFEADRNVAAKKRNGWLKLLQDLGYSPQFIAADQLHAVTNPKRPSALVLSEVYALSEAQIEAALDLQATAFDGGAAHTLLFGGPAGEFDERGRLRTAQTKPTRNAVEQHLAEMASKQLASYAAPARLTAAKRQPGGSYQVNLIGWSDAQVARFQRRNYGVVSVSTNQLDIVGFARARQKGAASEWYSWAAPQIPVVRSIVVPPETCTRIYRFALGDARLIAFERNVDYHMSEDLKQAGGNELLEKPARIVAKLAERGHVYELRTGTYLGETDTLTFTIDPWKPSLFAVTREKLKEADVVAALLACVSR